RPASPRVEGSVPVLQDDGQGVRHAVAEVHLELPSSGEERARGHLELVAPRAARELEDVSHALLGFRVLIRADDPARHGSDLEGWAQIADAGARPGQAEAHLDGSSELEDGPVAVVRVRLP